MTIRNLIAIVVSVALLIVLFKSLLPEKEDAAHLVVASWGGSFQAAQRRAIFEPFTAETGIAIIEVTGPSLAKIRTMAESGKAEWDVALLTRVDVLRLTELGYIAELPYDDPKFALAAARIDEHAKHSHGIGDFFSSKVIAYNTDRYSEENHPRTWKEFWDTDGFPGLRVIDAGDWSVPPVEYALLADGVQAEQLYPLDFERAYRSIARLQPHVLKFSASPAMPAQALVDGEAALAAVTYGRIAQLQEQGAPVGFEWNEGLMDVNYWAIIRHTRNLEAAESFLVYTTRPAVQAAMAKLQPLGPSNPAAFDLLSEERARQLPTYPENRKKQILVNAEFWAQRDDTGKSMSEKNAELWRRFVLAN